MSDLELRRRELAWRASGAVEAERAYRRAQVRAGAVDEGGLEALAALQVQVRSDDLQALRSLTCRADGVLTHVLEAGLHHQRVVRGTSAAALRDLLDPIPGLRVSRVEIRSHLVVAGSGQFEANC